MCNKYILAFILSSLFCHLTWSQNCTITVSGIIVDESTSEALDYASVVIMENMLGAISNSTGIFVIRGLCPGSYHLKISHIGCESEQFFINLRRDTTLRFYLHHHIELLNEIEIHGSNENSSAQSASSIAKEEISRSANKTLSELLEKITGVNSIKNGSGISKPVIHGMYGNRITILNNGLVQAGQQWGNDHAPEIDPFMADHLTVIKGASSLAHGGNGLGSIVLIENNPIDQDPHIHGQVNSIFQTNGRGLTLNTRIQQYHKELAWKLSGTFKRIGDNHAPNYYLTNTGRKEHNMGIQLEKKWNRIWSSRFIASSFNASMGILRGSHIGSVTDLTEAIHRNIPFFTRDTFSYHLQAPRQEVHHQLIKLENKWQTSNHSIWNFNYGLQANSRKEYDVRRSGRSDLPALSLIQYSQLLEGDYQHTSSEGIYLKTGLQLNVVDNANNPGTGILPLIPDFLSWRPSTYVILQKDMPHHFIEGGIRLDQLYTHVYEISKSLPRSIIHHYHTFSNLSSSIGYKYKFTDKFSLSANMGYVLRSPEVNELYSFGLHQGVSGLEEGNPDLKQEKSLKGLLSLEWNWKDLIHVQAQGYYHRIQDYIYLQPRQEFRLTIRGAFPVYEYRQTDADLLGTDLLCSFHISEAMKWINKMSLIHAKDRINQNGLVFTPAAHIQSSISVILPDSKKLKSNSILLEFKHVFKKNNILPEQDFLSPPPAYSLLNLEAGTEFKTHSSVVKCSVQVENALNSSYRDYLDRLRYFADAEGRNISIRLNYSF